MTIQVIDRQHIRFKKLMWHESELLLAKCFNFSVDNETGVIMAEIKKTAKRALYEFIRIAFKNFSEALEEADNRERFYSEVEEIYTELGERVDEICANTLPYNNKLYMHQREVLREAWHKQYNLMALSMGLGKSLTSASLSVMDNIGTTLIACPNAVKYNWFRDLTSKFGFNEATFSILDASKSKTINALMERFIVVNYDIIGKHTGRLLKSNIDHFILDECFVYDTLVQTSFGPMKIGDIVERNIFCYVLSHDSLNNDYVYKPVTRLIKKERKERLIKISSNGQEIFCTENHKIYTDSGWKKAIQISDRDRVLVLQKEEDGEEKRKGNCEILQSKMREPIQSKQSCFYRESKIERNGEKVKSSKFNLSNMLKRIFRNKQERKIEEEVLWHKVFGKMENEQQGIDGEEKKTRSGKEFNEYENCSQKESFNSQRSIRKNEKEQPNVQSYSKGENGTEIKRKNFYWPWRERGTNKAAESIGEINESSNGICNTYSEVETFIQKFTKLLQGGFGHTGEKTGDRDRWTDPQAEKVEILGQKENGSVKFFRVDSVEVLERGSRFRYNQVQESNFVYDLTVEDTHNYFANNILVSNCHLLKNHTTGRAKQIFDIISEYPDARITLLSGTPIKNRVNDVFSYLKLTHHELGKNHKKFLDEYTIRANNRGGERVTGGKNLNDLHVKLSNFMIRKTKEECLDLPEKVYLNYRFEMDDYREEYNKIIKELSEHRTVSSINGNLHSLNIVTSKAKIKGVIEMAETIIEEGRKLSIFSSYKEPLSELEKHFGGRCVKIDGSVSAFDRDRLVQKFINDPECTVFLGNYIAAGVGINLVNASDIIPLNFPFTPAEFHQAIDRHHRIGQTSSVNIHLPICEESIDEYIHDMILDKEADANAVIDKGKDVVTRTDMTQILIKKLLGEAVDESTEAVVEDAVNLKNPFTVEELNSAIDNSWKQAPKSEFKPLELPDFL